MDYKIENQVRGMRIVSGDEVRERRALINKWSELLGAAKFNEIILPTVEMASIYSDKAGAEILNQMYVFDDRKGRKLCLRPEGTATCQLLAQEVFKRQKDVKIWYDTRCYRYERPQKGRYREFSQLGVEILNPRRDTGEELLVLAKQMLAVALPDSQCVWDETASRGLAYYTDLGFECKIPLLGAQQQVLGGGSYKEGAGFAFGVERILLARQICRKKDITIPELL